MRLLFLGDMVGRSGRTAVWERLPGLISDLKLDFVIVNGENAAGGFGITEEIYRETLAAGADVVTTGNHVWDQREALEFAPRDDRFLRPANFPKGTPGKGSGVYLARNGARVLRLQHHGPRLHASRARRSVPVRRARAGGLSARRAGRCGRSSISMPRRRREKMCFAHFVDGRASLVVGTHTHQPTADHQILNGGTGYMSDAGMCGDYDSSLGMDKEEPLNRFLSKVPKGRFEAAAGPATHLRRRRRHFRPHRARRADRAAQARAAARRNRAGLLVVTLTTKAGNRLTLRETLPISYHERH